MDPSPHNSTPPAPSPTSSPLSIIQTNLQHSQTATACLRRALEMKPRTIALIQEPWIRNNRICGLGNIGGKLILDTQGTDKPRTCAYIPKDVPTTTLTQLCSRDLTAVRLKTDGDAPDIVLASVYMPGEDEDCPPKEMADLVRYCEDANLDLVICTDSNAHHPLWGCNKANTRGEVLCTYLFSTNLNIVNRGSEPTWVTARGQTIIDLTLASESATKLISNWHVSNEPSCSDHRRIRFSLVANTKKPEPRRNPRRTNVPGYKRLLASLLTQHETPLILTDPKQLEDTVIKLSEYIIEAYHACCKLKDPNTKSKGNSWWNAELSKLRQTMRKQFNIAKNSRLPEDWDQYKKTQYTFKKQVRQASRAAWRKFCEEIESNSEAARVRKILSTDQDRTLGSLKNPDNTYTKSDHETSKILLETHFPDCTLSEDRAWASEPTHTPNDQDWSRARTIVTEDRIKWAIKTFKPYKSAGLDEIFPALLQWGVDVLTPWLAVIYQACLALNYVPLEWREVKVIFIPKPGKPDYTQPKAYRPISLTSFLLKTLERLCDRHIRDGPLRELPLNKQQHAYSTGKSTESALHSVISKIECAVDYKCSSLAVFIDIEGAFDKTIFHSINAALEEHGVDSTLRGWITNMLRLRAVQVTVNDTTRAIVAKGCPQGGVLSPLLWNLVVDSLIKRLNDRGYYTVGYADDITIIINGTHENTLCNLMRQALKIVEDWCKEYKLAVNPTKTELVLFTKKRKLATLQLPRFFGTTLSLSTETKYLGIYLDKQLNWSKHTDYITTKASIALWQCKRLLGRNWGLSPKITHWLYTTVIRPIITYGSLVWWPRTNLSTAQKDLEKLQRFACVAITGSMRTSPTAALQVMLGLPPLHLVVREEAALATFRLEVSGTLSNDSRIKHTRLKEDAIKQQPMMASPNDRTLKTHCFQKHYNIELTAEMCDYSGPKELRIYTDGSKTDDGTGVGVFSDDLNIKISKSLGMLNSVYQAECVGIIQAAHAIEVREVTDTHIRILSDSASVLQSLKKNQITSRLILECHNALERVTVLNRNKVTLQWIKGHSGSLGNDAADELARRGSSAKAFGPEPIVPIPFKQLRSWLKDHTQTQAEKWWTSTPGCRQSKEAMPSLDRKLTKRLLRLDRDGLRLVSGTITGHCPLNKHFHTLGITDSPLCRACMEAEETVAHVLLECTGVTQIREEILGTPRTLADVLRRPGSLICFWREVGWLE